MTAAAFHTETSVRVECPPEETPQLVRSRTNVSETLCAHYTLTRFLFVELFHTTCNRFGFFEGLRTLYPDPQPAAQPESLGQVAGGAHRVVEVY